MPRYGETQRSASGLATFTCVVAADDPPASGPSFKLTSRYADLKEVKLPERSIALGAGQLFWVFVFGLFLFLGSATDNGPYRGASAVAAQQVARGLFFFLAAFYVIFHLGFVSLASRRDQPLLAWASIAVASTAGLLGVALVLSPASAVGLGEAIGFFVLPLVLLAFGGTLLMAGRALGRNARAFLCLLDAGGPGVCLFGVAWWFKCRILRAAERAESPRPRGVGSHYGATSS